MTDDHHDTTHSRRALVKAGALASGGLILGRSSAERAAAQEDGTGVRNGLAFTDEYRPGAQFRVISAEIDETPALDAVPESIWEDYAVRVVEYLVTGEEVLLFPAVAAAVGHGEVYEFRPTATPYEDGAAEGLVEVEFVPVPPEDRLVEEGAVLERGRDYEVREEAVWQALVPLGAFFGGGLFVVVSDVVDWTPEAIDGTGRDTTYTTRFASYLNAGDEFLLHPAAAADLERGGVYVMREDFTPLDRDPGLVEVTVDRVDEATLPPDLR